MKTQEQPPERPAPKPPIYPVWVIEVACQALTALPGAVGPISPAGVRSSIEARETAIRIIRDGLASHERAIKGEP